LLSNGIIARKVIEMPLKFGTLKMVGVPMASSLVVVQPDAVLSLSFINQKPFQ